MAGQHSNSPELASLSEALKRALFMREADEAAVLYKDLLTAKPDYLLRGPVQYDLACVLERNGHDDLALEAYRLLIDHQPDNQARNPALKAAGHLADRLKKFDLADRFLREFLKSDPLYNERQEAEDVLKRLPATVRKQDKSSTATSSSVHVSGIEEPKEEQAGPPGREKAKGEGGFPQPSLPGESRVALEWRVRHDNTPMPSPGGKKGTGSEHGAPARSPKPAAGSSTEGRDTADLSEDDRPKIPPRTDRPKPETPAPDQPPPPAAAPPPQGAPPPGYYAPYPPPGYYAAIPPGYYPPPAAYPPGHYPPGYAAPMQPGPTPPPGPPAQQQPPEAPPAPQGQPEGLPRTEMPTPPPTPRRGNKKPEAGTPPGNEYVPAKEDEDERYERLRRGRFALLLPRGKRIRLDDVAAFIAGFEKIGHSEAKKLVLHRKGLLYDNMDFEQMLEMSALVEQCRQAMAFVHVPPPLRPVDVHEILSAQMHEKGLKMSTEYGREKVRWGHIRLLNCGTVGNELWVSVLGGSPMQEFRFIDQVFDMEDFSPRGTATLGKGLREFLDFMAHYAVNAEESHTVEGVLTNRNPEPKVFSNEDEYQCYTKWMLFSHYAEAVDPARLSEISRAASNW